MDIERKYRWSLTGFIIMVVINIGILLTLWMNLPDPRNGFSDRGNSFQDSRPMHEYFQERLNLTHAQLDTVSSLRRRHYRDMRENRRQLDEKRKAYIDFVMSERDDNEAFRDSLLNELTHHYTKMEREMFLHMREMRSVLDEEQQRAFGEMMKRSFGRNNVQQQRSHKRR
ncbi:MAG TPA: hypothetical protein DD671_19890 [Balneolaceae bacterium]|nr:hypothetical protein [Balneolaceae bacterium]